MWKQAIPILALFLASLACGSSPKTSSPDLKALSFYEADTLALLERVANGEALDRIEVRAHGLKDLSVEILGGFAVRYPACGPYLRAALRVTTKLDSLSLEEIERDYHADGALPEAPDFCYHAKDLVVHPATVILLTRESDTELTRGRISAEMQEVRAHLGQVRKLLEAS